MSHPIHLAHLDKVRPVLVLTRASVRQRRTRVSIAPITSTVRGLSVEVPVGPEDGLDKASIVNLDEVLTVSEDILGPQIGSLALWKEPQLAAAVSHAFDLTW